MPLRGENSDLVRLVRGVRGRVRMRMELTLRFGYGEIVPGVRQVEHHGQRLLLAVGGPHMTVLSTPIQTRGENEHGLRVRGVRGRSCPLRPDLRRLLQAGAAAGGPR
jgi:hypothetical protein